MLNTKLDWNPDNTTPLSIPHTSVQQFHYGHSCKKQNKGEPRTVVRTKLNEPTRPIPMPRRAVNGLWQSTTTTCHKLWLMGTKSWGFGPFKSATFTLCWSLLLVFLVFSLLLTVLKMTLGFSSRWRALWNKGVWYSMALIRILLQDPRSWSVPPLLKFSLACWGYMFTFSRSVSLKKLWHLSVALEPYVCTIL